MVAMKILKIIYFEAYVAFVMVFAGFFLYFYYNDIAMILLVRATQTDSVDNYIGGKLRD